jgi:RHH-type proline utilization regulon transcriptional repressor/proline dehydrogenase/delta 1-pyrroline-5-carboxylate dehydrogenase
MSERAVAVDVDRLEAEIRAVGAALLDRFPSGARHPLRALDERAMELSARDGELRAALFRLVDVTPACDSLDDLARHLVAFADELDDPPPPLEVAVKAAATKAGRVALGAAAAAAVRHMGHRFIAAERPEAAAGEIRRLWGRSIGASLDLLGEASLTAAEADAYAKRCSDALADLARIHAELPSRPRLDADPGGPIPRANLSVKVTALTPLLRPDAPRRGVDDAAARLRPLLREAASLDAHLHIDMESLDTRETTLELLFELLAEPELRDGPSIGVVLQAYLRDSRAELDQLTAWAAGAGRGRPLTIRLVKGAYWDHEIVEAGRHGWQAPVFESKAESDRSFEALSATLLDSVRNHPSAVRAAFGSHNLRSVAHAIAYNRLSGGDDGAIEVQVLRGLGDDLAEAVASSGLRARVYCPVGDLVAGMAYLVRRLLENTANDSFLLARTHESLDELLAPP